MQAGATKRKAVKIVYDSDMWRTHYDNIITMRQKRDAAVDIMGCEKCGDPSSDPKIFRYQCLVSLMLSSQTKDEVTYAAMERLKSHGLTVPNILKTDDHVLGKLIHPVGFWRKKVDYIRRSSIILQEKYNEDIPGTIEELCKLPGVGPKMAYLCMSIAWKKTEGIGVDTHVHRIANRLGWVNTKSPEATRQALESFLPKDVWSEVNWMLVGFGQQVCTPINPKCGTCLNSSICPNSSMKKSKVSNV